MVIVGTNGLWFVLSTGVSQTGDGGIGTIIVLNSLVAVQFGLLTIAAALVYDGNRVGPLLKSQYLYWFASAAFGVSANMLAGIDTFEQYGMHDLQWMADHLHWIYLNSVTILGYFAVMVLAILVEQFDPDEKDSWPAVVLLATLIARIAINLAIQVSTWSMFILFVTSSAALLIATGFEWYRAVRWRNRGILMRVSCSRIVKRKERVLAEALVRGGDSEKLEALVNGCYMALFPLQLGSRGASLRSDIKQKRETFACIEEWMVKANTQDGNEVSVQLEYTMATKGSCSFKCASRILGMCRCRYCDVSRVVNPRIVTCVMDQLCKERKPCSHPT